MSPTDWLMAWLFGAGALGSLYALIIWIPLIVSRFFDEDFRGIKRDGYLHLSAANMFSCMSTTGLTSERLYSMLADGEHPTFFDPIVAAACMFLLVIARGQVIYASGLNGRRWRWRGYIGLLIGWSVLLGLRL